MLKSKQVTIGHPERDEAFQKLKDQQEAAHSELEAAGVELTQMRRVLDDAEGQQTLTSPGSPANEAARETAKNARERMSTAEQKRTEAKRELRRLADELPRAREKAARDIARQAAPAFNEAARAYLVAALQRLAPEMQAAETIRRLTTEANVRRVARVGWAEIHSHTLAERQHAQLRADTQAALAAGVLKRGDLPQEIREAWGIV